MSSSEQFSNVAIDVDVDSILHKLSEFPELKMVHSFLMQNKTPFRAFCSTWESEQKLKNTLQQLAEDYTKTIENMAKEAGFPSVEAYLKRFPQLRKTFDAIIASPAEAGTNIKDAGLNHPVYSFQGTQLTDFIEKLEQRMEETKGRPTQTANSIFREMSLPDIRHLTFSKNWLPQYAPHLIGKGHAPVRKLAFQHPIHNLSDPQRAEFITRLRQKLKLPEYMGSPSKAINAISKEMGWDKQSDYKRIYHLAVIPWLRKYAPDLLEDLKPVYR